eukprot:10456557-Lingulodinium_polyedra.AAC.1
MRNTKTANARPGRMPLVGHQSSPKTPLALNRRSAQYAAHTGPATHVGAPDRPNAGSRWLNG